MSPSAPGCVCTRWWLRDFCNVPGCRLHADRCRPMWPLHVYRNSIWGHSPHPAFHCGSGLDSTSRNPWSLSVSLVLSYCYPQRLGKDPSSLKLAPSPILPSQCETLYLLAGTFTGSAVLVLRKFLIPLLEVEIKIIRVLNLGGTALSAQRRGIPWCW